MKNLCDLEALQGIKRLIYIVGCQRSGTTLLGQVLGCHQSAILLDEFDGLYPWFDAWMNKSPDLAALTQKILAKAATKYKTAHPRVLEQNNKTLLTSTIDTLVLKAPNLTFEYTKIADTNLETYILYPVRDPRAVVASMLKLKHIDFVGNQLARLRNAPHIQKIFPAAFQLINNETQEYWRRAAKVWLIKSSLATSFHNVGLPTLQFTYEDFAINPQLYKQRISDFCQLNDTLGSHEDIYVGQGPGNTDRTRAVDTASFTQWKDILSNEQAIAILKEASPLAEQIGYT